ncbi:D-alanyl-D-alanine carboxypeptidase/D-alanyl-D-alanine-endopeptidase [Pokkaliibacter sp. CJK22405]|uniref:D-alanyl-D-alanine carboxypeptidase/D-alanyl-D-alanine-endopeptidase n=1 Tax=Pokkaliibacter sp. CJK22405 TaxID=3384615 RepID=UPI003985080E
MRRIFKPLTLSASLLVGTLGLVQTSHAESLNLPNDASLWVEGHSELSKNLETPRVPASTIKLLTAFYAINVLGLDYHYKTPLWLDHDGILWVEGRGDPTMTSETLMAMADYIRSRGITAVKGIGIDNSYFTPDELPDGIEDTLNPYDAKPGAVILNYNTLYLKRTNDGIASAEIQTPLTPTAFSYASRLKGYRDRINLGTNPVNYQTYFAEQLRVHLQEKGIKVRNLIQIGKRPPQASSLGEFSNPDSLEDVLSNMLYYSNNVIANQLFLTLGAQQLGAPASLGKAQTAMNNFVAQRFKWPSFHIEEGSGLSRKTHITVLEMGQLLEAFQPYQKLLKTEAPGIQAKTGTLSDVRAFAGYIQVKDQWLRFALLMGNPRRPGLRLDVAKDIQRALDGNYIAQAQN